MRTNERNGDGVDVDEASEATAETEEDPGTGRRRSRVRAVAMRPRRTLVKVHRWLAIALMAWLVVISLTGAWLVSSDAIESWFHGDRYTSTSGDVGPQAALDAARATLPDDATIYGVVQPGNGRGVYQVGAEIPVPGAPEPVGDALPAVDYKTVYVDPGTGTVNGTRNDEEGFTWWFYRGHMYLWQDYGIFGVFDPETGWCRPNAAGAEPGGVKGVVCDVIPDGEDMTAWLGVGFIVVLLVGFYLWYWPGVRRWANALRVQRKRGPFAFNMSLHKLIGLVVFVPLLVIAFTGIAFGFPNMKGWFENVTPAQRGAELWVSPDDAMESEKAAGRDPIGLDGFADVLEANFPEQTIEWLGTPEGKRGVYMAWTTRGFSPWTREAGAGNVWITVDQYTGEVLYEGTPEDGNVFDQLWSDWSYPLHTGDFGGTATRMVWIVIGLSPMALGITGITMYVIRRRKRARRGAPVTTETDVAPSVPERELHDAPVG